MTDAHEWQALCLAVLLAVYLVLRECLRRRARKP
jgi:hypothetical protein